MSYFEHERLDVYKAVKQVALVRSGYAQKMVRGTLYGRYSFSQNSDSVGCRCLGRGRFFTGQLTPCAS